MAINTITITGNLGKDAEARESANGTKITRWSLAFTERRRDDSGNWSNETGWIGCVVFGDRGEKLASKLLKGQNVTVQGRLHCRTWKNKDGKEQKSYEIIVDEIAFGPEKAAAVLSAAAVDAGVYDDDVVF